jgi:hypothetical protein
MGQKHGKIPDETKIKLRDICTGLLSSANRDLDSYFAEVLNKWRGALEGRQKPLHPHDT